MKEIKKIEIPFAVLDNVWQFLRSQGKHGFEGAALFVGRCSDGIAVVERAIIPDQVPTKSAWGVSVALTQEAHLRLTDDLRPGERLVARIHSHPSEAYHSACDASNPVITHVGAVSIVVPDFASRDVSTKDLAVFVMSDEFKWTEVVSEKFVKVIYE